LGRLSSSDQQTLRILLVSARTSVRQEVDDALMSTSIDHQLYWVSQSDLALIRAQELMPDVILVDDELEGADAIALIRQLAARVVSSAILTLIAPDEVNIAGQAVLAGARGFMIKPLNADDLLTTLAQVLLQRQSMSNDTRTEEEMSGRVVVFCSSKGGTGRTTLALNTAVSLRTLTNKPVIIVDADFAAPALDVALNLHSDRSIVDLLPRLSHFDEELAAGILASHVSGIQVLLASPEAGHTFAMSLPQVQQVLVALKRMFAWVIVDLGLPLDEAAFAFLDSADRIVITVLPEMVGLRNTRLMIDQLHAAGYPDDKTWLVVNRATLRGGVTVKAIEERLGMAVKHSVPDDQPLATHSINLGVPVVMGYPRSAVAHAMVEMAQQLVDSLTLQGVTLRRDSRSNKSLLGSVMAAVHTWRGRLGPGRGAAHEMRLRP